VPANKRCTPGYLGVHYPGDVLSGSLLGMVLARIHSHVLHKIGAAPE
jgi:hypothetical protein